MTAVLVWVVSLLLELAVTGLCINKSLLSTAMPSCQSQFEEAFVATHA